MPAIDITTATLTELAALVKARSVSPLELTQAYLDRIARLNPIVNAYITVTTERALADAHRAGDEIAAGQYRGALHGIPIALKDLYATAGIRTTAGSKILADWIPDADSTVARRLREAGSVLLGKLNTHEFAYGGTTNNPHYGPTRNPWNLDCVPGGSSGGSAAAIAASLAAGTMGTDTAGSVRQPASLCGVVGLKPAYGRVSTAGVVPLSWSFDHAGPITRSIQDAALMLQVIAGYDAADSSTVPMPVTDFAAGLGTGVRGMHLGVARSYFFDELEDEVRAVVEAALQIFRDLGAEVRDVELEHVAEGTAGRTYLSGAEARLYHDESLRTRPQDFGADTLARLQREQPDARTLTAGLQACRALATEMRQTMQTVDVLLSPTVPTVAPRIDAPGLRGGPGTPALSAQALLQIRCTAPFNATRLPAISVPCGFSASGLPIGLQIAGRPFDEATVLRVAHAYEQATDWHLRRPSGLEEAMAARN